MAELIAGRMPFAEAVARFRELDAIYPAGLRASYPGQTEEERLGHAMVDYACEELAEYPPDRAARIRARLEADLAGFLEANGSPAPAGACRKRAVMSWPWYPWRNQRRWDRAGPSRARRIPTPAYGQEVPYTVTRSSPATPHLPLLRQAPCLPA